MRPDLDGRGPLGRAQDDGDEPSLFVKHDDRFETVVVIMGVEQAQLLFAVNGVEGVSLSALAKAPSMSRMIRRGTYRNSTP
jgi:hypothetical protein